MSRTRRPRPTSRRPAPRRQPTATLRGRAEEFAAALPDILGYPPTESLVLLCLGGAGRPPRRMSLTLRADLEATEHDGSVVAALVGHVRRVDPPPWGALVFVVSEDPDDQVRTIRVDPWRISVPRPDAAQRPEVPDLPRRGLVHACIEQLSEQGITIVDAVLVRDGRWWSYPDVDRLTGAGPGDPLDEDSSRLAGLAALSGRTVDPDRATTVARAWPTAAPTAPMEAACVRADDALAQRVVAGGVAGAVETSWAAVRRALTAYAPGSRLALTEDEAAEVGVALQLVPVRDRALSLVAAAEDDEAAAAEALWTDLNTRLPTDLAGVPALLLGLTAWLGGSGVLAVAALERSLACGPTAMGQMLLQAVTGNLPPEQLRAAMSGWEDDEVA